MVLVAVDAGRQPAILRQVAGRWVSGSTKAHASRIAPETWAPRHDEVRLAGVAHVPRRDPHHRGSDLRHDDVAVLCLHRALKIFHLVERVAVGRRAIRQAQRRVDDAPNLLIQRRVGCRELAQVKRHRQVVGGHVGELLASAAVGRRRAVRRRRLAVVVDAVVQHFVRAGVDERRIRAVDGRLAAVVVAAGPAIVVDVRHIVVYAAAVLVDVVAAQLGTRDDEAAAQAPSGTGLVALLCAADAGSDVLGAGRAWVTRLRRPRRAAAAAHGLATGVHLPIAVAEARFTRTVSAHPRRAAHLHVGRQVTGGVAAAAVIHVGLRVDADAAATRQPAVAGFVWRAACHALVVHADLVGSTVAAVRALALHRIAAGVGGAALGAAAVDVAAGVGAAGARASRRNASVVAGIHAHRANRRQPQYLNKPRHPHTPREG